MNLVTWSGWSMVLNYLKKTESSFFVLIIGNGKYWATLMWSSSWNTELTFDEWKVGTIIY